MGPRLVLLLPTPVPVLKVGENLTENLTKQDPEVHTKVLGGKYKEQLFSPCGDRILTASPDKTARPRRARPAPVLRAPPGWPAALVVSADIAGSCW